MRWIKERKNLSWNLEYSGVTAIVAFIARANQSYSLYIWDKELTAFEPPIKLLTLEDAKNMGVMLVKLRYSEVNIWNGELETQIIYGVLKMQR